jgi:urease accessory protein
MLLHLTELLSAGTPTGTATLTLDERRRSRLRLTLDDGREAALLLPRGSALRDGDLLGAEGGGGDVIVVRAAPESLSVASTPDAHTLLRGAYHLGNRHVPVQIGAGWLAYEHDHVLDDMVRGLGLTVEARRAPFEPEGGAFRHEGNGHTHGGGHSHGEADHHHHGGGHRHS